MDLAKVGVRVDAEGINQFVHDMNEASDEFNSFGAKADRAGQSLTAKFTAPLINLGKESFFAASDVGEAASKLNVIFGDQANNILKFADTATDNIGLSAATARGAVGDFGNLFTTIGIGANGLGFDIGKLAGDLSGMNAKMLNSADPAVALSEAMTALAGDLTSFTNIPIDQSLGAIQSALIGEYEPMRKFGVILNEDTIKAKALELGLVGANDEMDQQAKTAAITALILEKTANAHGDAAETADSAANSYRRFQNRVSDLKETIGMQLLPVGMTLINWGLKLTDVLNGLSPTALKIVVVIGALVAAIGPALVYLAKFIEAWRVVQSLFAASSAASAAGGAGPFAALLGPIGLVIAGLVALGVAYKTNFLGFADAVNAAARGIADAFSRIVGWFKQFFDAIGRVQSGSSAAETVLNRLPGPIARIAEFLGNVIRSARLFYEGLQHLGDESGRFTKILHQLPGPLQDILRFIDALVGSFFTLRKEGFDPISAALYGLVAGLQSIGGDNTPAWIVKLSNQLATAAKYTRLFIEALGKMGEDSQRVHKILNVLPEPLQKIFLVIARVVQAVQVFRKAWSDAGALAAFRTLPRSIELIGRSFGNLIESITGFTHFADEIKRLFKDIGDLIGDVVNLVDDLVHGRWKESWNDFLEIVKDLVTLVIDYFRTSLALFRDVFGLLVDVFNSIDWGAVGNALLSGISAAFDFMFGAVPDYLVQGFKAIPWDVIFAAALDLGLLLVAKGGELMQGFLNGAQEFVTSTVIPFIRRLGSQILAAIPGLLTTLVTKGVEIITGFLTGARDFLTERVIPFFRDLITRALSNLPAVGDFLGALISVGESLVKGFYNAAFDFWENHVRPFFEKFIARIAKNLPSPDEFLDAIKWIADKVLGGLRDHLPEVFDAAAGVGAFFADILKKIIAKLPAANTIFKGLQFLADEILGGIRDKLDTVFDAAGGIAEFFKNIVTKISDLIPDNFDSITGAFATITAALNEFIKPLKWVIDNAGKVTGWIGKLIPGGGSNNNDNNAPTNNNTGSGTGPTSSTGTLTINFEGAQALKDIAQWVKDVSATLTPLSGFFDFGGGSGEAAAGAANFMGVAASSVGSKAHPKDFDGQEFLDKVSAWVTNVTNAISNEKDHLLNYIIFPTSGTGAVGNVAKIHPYPFDGTGFLRDVRTFVGDVTDEFKRMNLASSEQVKALHENIKIRFGEMKTTIADKTFDARNAAVNEFIGMRTDLTQLAADIRAKVAGSDKGSGEFSKMKSDIEGIIRTMGAGIGGEIWTVNVHRKIVDKAFDTRNAVVNEFVGMRNDVSQIIRNFGSNVANAILSWKNYAYYAARDVGGDIGEGFYDGMGVWLQAIINRAAHLVAVAVQAIYNAAGRPHSPASVTVPLGRALAQGLDFGMFLEEKNVNTRFANLVASTVGQNFGTNSNVSGTLATGGGNTYNMFLLSSDELIRLQQGAEAGLGLNDTLFRESTLRLQGTGGFR